MYTGKIVEEAPVAELFARPRHPYTEGLLRSVPKLTMEHVAKKERLETIEGVVPNPTDLPPGCHFAPRCQYRLPRCEEGEIPLYDLEGDVKVRCVLFDLAAAVTSKSPRGRRSSSSRKLRKKIFHKSFLIFHTLRSRIQPGSGQNKPPKRIG